MKKLMILLVILLLTAFAHAETNPWSLEGYFVDADKNYLGIFASDDPAEPGWYVGGELGENMFGAVIQQEGDTLHGDVGQENGTFIVTVAAEGDGVRLTLEDGTTHHLSKYEAPEPIAIVALEADGLGQIALAEGDEPLAFDDESLIRGAVLELVEPADYTFAARADEGYRFVKWTKNGETFSTDAQITLALTESADYVAVFRAYNPYAGEPVSDIGSAHTIGDVLALSNGNYTASESLYVTTAELDDVVYRVEAAMDAETSKALFALDFEDPDYQRKFTDLVSPLPITRIENLTAQIPSREALDALIGKTCEELLNDGWTCEGWTLEGPELNELVFHLNHGPFAYGVTFDGAEDLPDGFNEADLKPLTVASVTYSGIGDATAIEGPEETPGEDEMASEQADRYDVQAVAEQPTAASATLPVKVLLLPKFEIGEMTGDFPGEAQYYYEQYLINAVEYDVPYSPYKLYYKDGVALSLLGIGKVNAALDTMAILSDSRFDYSKAYIISTGCAGSSAGSTVMGDVFIITSAVDYDLGHQADARDIADSDGTTWFHDAFFDDAAVVRLNPALMEKVYALVKDTPIETTETTRNYMRAAFDGADWAVRDPQVQRGTTVTGDNYWKGQHGHENALLMVQTYQCPDPYALTEMEDVAVARAVERMGMLDRFIIIRDSVNMDVFMLDATPESLWGNAHGFALPNDKNVEVADIFRTAMKNNFEVGRIIIDLILAGQF